MSVFFWDTLYIAKFRVNPITFLEIVRGENFYTETHTHTLRPILCLFSAKSRNKTKKTAVFLLQGGARNELPFCC